MPLIESNTRSSIDKAPTYSPNLNFYWGLPIKKISIEESPSDSSVGFILDFGEDVELLYLSDEEYQRYLPKEGDYYLKEMNPKLNKYLFIPKHLFHSLFGDTTELREREGLETVTKILEEAKQHGVEIEVVLSAMESLKEDPKRSISEAILRGAGEWLK